MGNRVRKDYTRLGDEKLMELFQTGFNEAFNEIVNRYQARLFYRIFSYTQNRQDSEDLVQDTFMCVARFKHYYSPAYKFSNWLYTIGRNQLITQYRKNSRIKMNSLQQEPQDIEILQDNYLHNQTFVSSIRKAIRQFPPIYSQVLHMRIIEERSYQEIMDFTGLPLGTIKSRIKRGRDRLRSVLKWYMEE